MHGKGLLTWADGQTFEGEFVDNMMTSVLYLSAPHATARRALAKLNCAGGRVSTLGPMAAATLGTSRTACEMVRVSCRMVKSHIPASGSMVKRTVKVPAAPAARQMSGRVSSELQ